MRIPPLANRQVPLEGQNNLRDLGGVPTADGRRVKPGRIFRSGELIHLTDSDLERLAAMAAAPYEAKQANNGQDARELHGCVPRWLGIMRRDCGGKWWGCQPPRRQMGRAVEFSHIVRFCWTWLRDSGCPMWGPLRHSSRNPLRWRAARLRRPSAKWIPHFAAVRPALRGLPSSVPTQPENDRRDVLDRRARIRAVLTDLARSASHPSRNTGG